MKKKVHFLKKNEIVQHRPFTKLVYLHKDIATVSRVLEKLFFTLADYQKKGRELINPLYLHEDKYTYRLIIANLNQIFYETVRSKITVQLTGTPSQPVYSLTSTL